MKFTHTLCLSLAGFSFFALNAQANTINVCKTTGSHGEVKYSQVVSGELGTTCTGELIGFRSDGRQNTPGEMAAPSIDPAQAAEQSRAAQLEQQIKEMEARETAQRCQTLRNSLANLNMGGRVYEMDADNNRTYLNAQEIDTRRKRTQQTIAQFCN